MNCIMVDTSDSKLTFDLTVNAKPVIKESVPVGIEIGWDLVYVYPSCWGHTNYTFSGHFGRNLKNEFKNFA